MVHAQTLDLVHRKKDPCQKQLVFFLERQGESVDDTAQNLEELGNSVETFSLINELEKHIVNGPPNVGAQVEEFSIYAVQGGF